MKKREINFNKIYKSNNSGDYKIIKEVPRKKGAKGNKRVIIKFIDTGIEREVDMNLALNGKVKDPTNYKGAKVDINKIYKSNNSGYFKIIKEVEKNIHGNRMVAIKFIKTGNSIIVPLSNALRGAVKDKNNYKDIYIDSNKVYMSNNYGAYIIINETKPDKNLNRRVIIRFINTGYEYEVDLRCALNGNVKDVYCPSVYGIGYLGEPDKSNPYYEMLYSVWLRMIRRCYDPNSISYNVYGGAGVKVCEEWHCFATFMNDAQALPNFNQKIKDPNNYQLDKDYLQQNVPKYMKVYSKDTCVWLHISDNNNIKNIDNNKIIDNHRNYVNNGNINQLHIAYDHALIHFEMPIKIINKNPQSKLLDFINKHI